MRADHYLNQPVWKSLLLFALWLTLLLGPVALMRYLLGLYDAAPVLIAALLIPEKKTPELA